jgi:hypothetical protein
MQKNKKSLGFMQKNKKSHNLQRGHSCLGSFKKISFAGCLGGKA